MAALVSFVLVPLPYYAVRVDLLHVTFLLLLVAQQQVLPHCQLVVLQPSCLQLILVDAVLLLGLAQHMEAAAVVAAGDFAERSAAAGAEVHHTITVTLITVLNTCRSIINMHLHAGCSTPLMLQAIAGCHTRQHPIGCHCCETLGARNGLLHRWETSSHLADLPFSQAGLTCK